MTPKEILLTNTLTGRKEPLKPMQAGKISFYSCGPTVYGFIHIGNLLAASTADLAYRVFKRAGYNVDYVRNFTDIDDKIIECAQKEGISAADLAKKFTTEVERDYAATGLIDPSRKVRATDHIPAMIKTIERIIAKGCAYEVGGEVLFSVRSFSGYGKLSGRSIDDLQAGARVEVNEIKRDPADFTLWKPAKPGEPSWPSPWGEGRPGWHIECSAMASQWLGDQIDVHHGGVDLIFPHHENEIAQSECASGRAPFVGCWIHNGHLTVNHEKMSKSLGNFVTAREFITNYSGEVARLLFLASHYRSPMELGNENISQAVQSLTRIYEAKQAAEEIAAGRAALPEPTSESLWGSFVMDCQKARESLDAAFFNDLNTPEALGVLFGLIREFNRVRGTARSQATGAAILAAQVFLQVIERDFGEVTAVGLSRPERALASLSMIRAKLSEGSRGDAALPSAEEIEALIEERRLARASKNFARSDEVRNELLARGVEIQDGPTGTKWRYKSH